MSRGTAHQNCTHRTARRGALHRSAMFVLLSRHRGEVKREDRGQAPSPGRRPPDLLVPPSASSPEDCLGTQPGGWTAWGHGQEGVAPSGQELRTARAHAGELHLALFRTARRLGALRRSWREQEGVARRDKGVAHQLWMLPETRMDRCPGRRCRAPSLRRRGRTRAPNPVLLPGTHADACEQGASALGLSPTWGVEVEPH